jgi:hypothetical protein
MISRRSRTGSRRAVTTVETGAGSGQQPHPKVAPPPEAVEAELPSGAGLVGKSKVVGPAELKRLPSTVPIELDPSFLMRGTDHGLTSKVLAPRSGIDRNADDSQLGVRFEDHRQRSLHLYARCGRRENDGLAGMAAGEEGEHRFAEGRCRGGGREKVRKGRHTFIEKVANCLER